MVKAHFSLEYKSAELLLVGKMFDIMVGYLQGQLLIFFSYFLVVFWGFFFTNTG